MAATIKISDPVMLALRRASALHNRSIAGQAEFWMRLGRAVERNPDMTLIRVEQALQGLLDPSELNGDEQEQFFNGFGVAMDRPSAISDAVVGEIHRQWSGMTLDENDMLAVEKRLNENA